MSPGQVPPERLTRVTDLFAIAGRLSPSTAVLSGGHRVEDLRLVESARDHGFVDRIILIGQKDRMAAAVREAAIDVAEDDMINAHDEEQIAAATIETLQAGGVDLILKSAVSNAVMNRHLHTLAVRRTASLVTMFDASPLAAGRPMLLTDAGETTQCDLDTMTDLVGNAVDVAQAVMGIERPRVAVLSASELQVDTLPSTRIGLELARQTWPDAVVCGPLPFDLATDPAAVAVQGVPDLPGAQEVAGQADVLVCPGIDTAHVLYKMIASLDKFGEASLASITVGYPVPYVSLSHSETLETRLASIALCAVYARRRPHDFIKES
jgi:phosphotransacetylase